MENVGKRVLIDSDGKKYKFYCTAFKKNINQVKAKQKCTIIRIRESLSEKLNYSVEAIKKWEGENGPSDIGLVRECAEYFSIDYHELLVPIDDNQEENMNNITEKDKQLVDEMFAAVINIVYNKVARLKDVYNIEDKAELKTEKYKLKYEIQKEISDLGRIVDRNAPSVSYDVRNKLHRIIIELNPFICHETMCDRWIDDIVDDDLCQELCYCHYSSRKDTISDNPVLYLMDEINLADKYSLKNITDIPIDESVLYDMDISELLKFGCEEYYGPQINNYDVYIDWILETLISVFKYDFYENKTDNYDS